MLTPVVAARPSRSERRTVAVFTLEDYDGRRDHDLGQASALKVAVEARRTYSCAGGTSSGKTTPHHATVAEVAKMSDRGCFVSRQRELSAKAPHGGVAYQGRSDLAIGQICPVIAAPAAR